MIARTLTKPNATVRIYRDPGELALEGACLFAQLADPCVTDSGRFTVALSGGSTPKAMLSILAGAPFRETLPWSSIYFFWGDERNVPPDHADSNYRMATEALLSKVPIPPQNIFRIPAELPDSEAAAKQYAATLTGFFSTTSVPQFDLVLLGMGPDGHTASLFPHTTALQAGQHEIVVANYVKKLDAQRITLTAATINNARNVTFLAAGKDKSDVLKEVLDGGYRPETYPSQLIRPKNGALLWMVDEAAALLLSEP